VIRKLASCFAVILTLISVRVPLSAHHGVIQGKKLTLQGTITVFEWQNPHCLIHIDVKDEGGETVSWVVETHPPSLMHHLDWSRNSLRPGDQVTLWINVAKDGKFVGGLVPETPPNPGADGIGVRFADGRTLKY